MAYNDFIEMPVWQLGDQIVGEVYRLTESLPKREDYALCSQLRDAAVSITGTLLKALGEDIQKIRSIFTISPGAVHTKYAVIFLAGKRQAILPWSIYILFSTNAYWSLKD